MSNSTNHSMKNKGPWLHRASILFFSILFGLLLFWLMGFIDRDIKYSGRPNYVDMERAQIPAELLERQDQRKAELNNVERKIAALKTDQQNLRDRTESQQKSLNQLVAIKRMKIEKNLVIEEQEQTALAELETQFLQDQKAYDALNQDLVALTETQHGLQDQIYQIETQLEAIRKTVREEYDKAVKAHEFQAAIVRLVVLVPVFALAIGFFVRERNGKYATMAYAFAIAVFVKALSVLHDYFPELYFKYILILLALALVGYILFALIRIMASPKREWLLRQYREAYEKFLCPICGFPIRRGPLKYLYWDKGSIRKLVVPAADPGWVESPYTCPSCGTRLYEECSQCQQIRYTLLPACETCGDEKTGVETMEK